MFEIARGTDRIRLVDSFDIVNGRAPYAGVRFDADGNLYGTATSGGSDDYYYQFGTVFKIAAGSHSIQALDTFNRHFGEDPRGVAIDAAGNLFGITQMGGAPGSEGYGTIFEIPRGTSTIQTLVLFDYDNGSHPAGELTLDAEGNLYGTTSGGNPDGYGTIYQLTGSTHTLVTLAQFGGSDGSHPQGGVTLDAAGNLFGTTLNGGAFGYGTVFELAKGSHTIRTIASFDRSNGAHPQATVTLDASGNLFGTTCDDGPGGFGTVFKIPHGTGVIQTLASFDQTNGAHPYGALVVDPAGNLYGTTNTGGPSGVGTVFKLSPPVPGDVNGDRKVEFGDLLILAQNYGKSATAGQGDLDEDGRVEFDDLLALGQNYGRDEPAGWAPTPFLGHPADVSAGVIEAEDFDRGAEGLAYHDTTPQNLGGTAYRNTAVDINAFSSNGYVVGHTAPGEWLAYSITSPLAGTFTIQATVASFKPGGKFHVEIDGQDVTGPMTVPDTGGWYTLQAITSPRFALSAGGHAMRVVMDSGGYWGTVGNFDSFRFVPAGVALTPAAAANLPAETSDRPAPKRRAPARHAPAPATLNSDTDDRVLED